jgi:hypothetical protein
MPVQLLIRKENCLFPAAAHLIKTSFCSFGLHSMIRGMSKQLDLPVIMLHYILPDDSDFIPVIPRNNQVCWNYLRSLPILRDNSNEVSL